MELVPYSELVFALSVADLGGVRRLLSQKTEVVRDAMVMAGSRSAKPPFFDPACQAFYINKHLDVDNPKNIGMPSVLMLRRALSKQFDRTSRMKQWSLAVFA